MRTNSRTYTKRNVVVSFLLFLSCFSLLSGCSSSSSGSSSGTGQTASGSPGAKVVGVATKTVDDPATLKARALLSKMSLDDKIAQMIMVEFLDSDYVASGLQAMIALHVGSVLYQPTALGNRNFVTSCTTIDCVHSFSAQVVADSKIAPLIAIDEEGGDVDKVSQFFSASPAAEDLAQSGDVQKAYDQGKTDAGELKQLGINVDLAPVVDVGPDSNLITTRMFSSDPATVARYAGAFAKGLQDNGIPATLKHFPGLGSDVSDDPHDTLPVVSKSLTDLKATDFVPYQQIIQQDNPAMIMDTDVLTQALDGTNPAEMSPKVISYLRHTLNFQGVLITDGMYMRGAYCTMASSGLNCSVAVGDGPTADQQVQASIQAITAGNDIVEGLSNTDEVSATIAGVEAEIQKGTLPQSQIDQSVLRILTMKAKYGIIK